MVVLSNKKIPTVVGIISICILLYSQLAKEYDPYESPDIYEMAKEGFKIPISYYHVNFLGIAIDYLTILLLTLISLAIGAYWFFYKSDEEIKKNILNARKKALSYPRTLKSIEGKKNPLFSIMESNKASMMTLKGTDKFWSANGRIRRRSYVIRVGVLIFIWAIIKEVFMQGPYIENYHFAIFLGVILGLIWLYIFFVQSMKRLQDMNKNGWWYLMLFIPFFNVLFFLYVIFSDGTVGSNRYGMDPKNR